jgi:hypothetical protein
VIVEDLRETEGGAVVLDKNDVLFSKPLPAGGPESPDEDVGVPFKIPL